MDIGEKLPKLTKNTMLNNYVFMSASYSIEISYYIVYKLKASNY